MEINSNMRKHLFIILFGISFYLFGQENTYRFLYDIHQETIFNDEMKKNTPKDFLPEIVNAFNESYEFEVLASKNYSFVKLIEKVKNSQNDAVRIYPEPNWLLNDFEHNKSYEFAEYGDTYVVDSIKIEGLKPTKEMKEILGLQAKKFIFENDEFYYEIWLAKMNGITVSPYYFQFKNFVVVELFKKFKKVEEGGGKMEKRYLLKEMSQEKKPTDFIKLIPKKVLTPKELQEKIDKINQMSQNNEVEK